MSDIKNITITPEILKLIADIDEFKGRWKVIETLAPEKLTTLRRIATIESVGSSTRSESFASRDEEEVAGYADAMDMIFDGYEAITTTENHIRQLHGVLLANRNTIKVHLKKLADQHYLAQVGKGRGARYTIK